MRALTIDGSDPKDRLGISELPTPVQSGTDLLVDGLLLGVCGTDRGLLSNGSDRLPPDRLQMVLGHESLGRVLEAPPGSGFVAGDLVTALVRRPDPVPCAACAAGDLDLCENGRFIERGIRGQDGYGAQSYLLGEEFAVGVGPLGLLGILIEPTSIVVKAWERIDLSVRRPGGRALVLGAGPIGLLAALLAERRGYEVHIVDQVTVGPKVDQSNRLGVTYHRGSVGLSGVFDVVLECSGVFTAAAVKFLARGGIACYIAHSNPHQDPGDERNAELSVAALSESLVRGNQTVFGTTSSSRSHFERARQELAEANPGWLEGLITDVVPMDDFRRAFEVGPGIIKSVLALSDEVPDHTRTWGTRAGS